MNILCEASGGLTTGYLIRAIQAAGHRAIASDINPIAVGRFLSDDFFLMPEACAPNLWSSVTHFLKDYPIDAVFPTLDETLLAWALKKADFLKKIGVHVILSPSESIAMAQDKWLTYQFFIKHHIPTPLTSLTQDFPLIKPRFGRGGKGISVTQNKVDMTDQISQVVLSGQEYTVDVFCDKSGAPIYIVPRARINVQAGKATAGIVVKQPEINRYIQQICAASCFHGPINIQCFVTETNDIYFTEINSRLGGGMALAFAATENWIALAVRHFIRGEAISPLPIQYGLRMLRYYSEVFI